MLDAVGRVAVEDKIIVKGLGIIQQIVCQFIECLFVSIRLHKDIGDLRAADVLHGL